MSVDPVAAYSDPIGAFNRYRYANSNPYRFTDPDGRWAEDLVIGIPSLIMGAKSFASNVREGNVGSAVVDAVGIIADVAGIATPGVPGGAGAVIGAARLADKAVDAGKAAGQAADSRKVWTATSDGVVLPPGRDIDAVSTSTPDPRNPSWGQVHSSHAHKGDSRAHAHGPEAGTGKRSDKPLGETMRRVDQGLKDGTLRERQHRGDKGG